MASPELDLVMKLLRSRPQVTGHDVAKMRGIALTSIRLHRR